MLFTKQQSMKKVWTPSLWTEVSVAIQQARETGTLTVIPWGRLDVTEYVAKGGFGMVCKGRHEGKEVAIKSLLPGAGEASELLEEMQTMSRLKHPNLLAMVGLATDYNVHLGVVMEYMPATLFHLIHSPAYLN